MKHLTTYITLFSTLLMANLCSSCSDNSIPGTDDNNAVQFSTTISSDNDWNPLSRVIYDGEPGHEKFVDGDKILVNGYYLPGGIDNNGEPDFMYNQQMTFNGTDWVYNPIKYWPNNKGDKLKFMAIYPYEDPARTQIGVTEKGYPIYRFEDCNFNNDCLATEFVVGEKTSMGEKVTLNFRHIMAKLRVQVKVPEFIDEIPPVKVEVKELWHHEFAKYGTFSGFGENGEPIWSDVSDKIVSIRDDKGYIINSGETVLLNNFTTFYPPSKVDNVSLIYRIIDSNGNVVKDYPGGYGETIIEKGKGIEIKAGYETTITVTINIYGIDNVQASSRPIAKWKDTTTTPVTF